MASVGRKSSEGGLRKSKAQRDLDFALGKNRVPLDDLSNYEFCVFLKNALDEVNLREMRGFTELRNLLSFASKEFLRSPYNLNMLVLGEGFKLTTSNPGLTLYDHVQDIGGCLLTQEMLYKRYESNETTGDEMKARNGWGQNGGYLLSGKRQILVLHRPRDDSSASSNLFTVDYWFVRVPKAERHVIHSIDISHLPPVAFRKRFLGNRAAEIACGMVSQLQTILDRTVDGLLEKSRSFERVSAKIKRMRDAVM